MAQERARFLIYEVASFGRDRDRVAAPFVKYAGAEFNAIGAARDILLECRIEIVAWQDDPGRCRGPGDYAALQFPFPAINARFR